MFSKACEYGIKAAIHISLRSQKGERVNLKAIAKAIDSPVAFTAKVLQSLAKNNLISSAKGTHGGYEIPEKQLAGITLFQIVKAIDGDNIYSACGLGLKHCSERKPCPMHFKFKKIRDDLKDMLKSTNIQELAKGLHQGNVFLTR